MKYMVDFGALAATIGAVEGAEEVADSDEYMEALFNSAFEKVKPEFNLEVIATATATGTLSHMFEFGTAGINRARTKRAMNPMNPESHLWHAKLVGHGKEMGVDFDFLPAKVPTPLPTTGRTGIEQRYIKKLRRRAVFWNKARVMEMGTPVTIEPKQASKLFIPHMGNPPDNARPADIKKGFTMYGGSVTFTPGRRHAGTFTAYWTQFWNGRGGDMMQTHAESQFNDDMERVLAEADKQKPRPGPPSTAKFKAEVSEGKKNGAATMKRGAKTRKKT